MIYFAISKVSEVILNLFDFNKLIVTFMMLIILISCYNFDLSEIYVYKLVYIYKTERSYFVS